MPERVATQQLPVVAPAVFVEGHVDPAFESGKVFIAGRQRAGGDQDAAQVLERLAVGHLVEGLVGQRPCARSKVGQDRGSGVLRQPVHHRLRPVGRGQGFVQPAQLGTDAAAAIVEQLPEAVVEGAAGAAAGDAEPFDAAAVHTGWPRDRF